MVNGRAAQAAKGGKQKPTAQPAAKAGATYGSEAHFDKAFGASAGARDNFVRLDHFRANLGGTREQQDAAIRAHRISRRYGLDTHEGLYNGKNWEKEKSAVMAAAIHDHTASKPFVYISRHRD